MENFDENLENEYRKRFENFDEMPDDLLWENIQARIKPEKERPFIVWLNTLRGPVGMAAAIVLALLIGIYFFIKTDNTQQLGKLPAKPDASTSQPQKPDVTQKENFVDLNNQSTDKVLNAESQQLTSAKANGNKTTVAEQSNSNLKNTDLPTTNNEAIAQTPVENKPEINEDLIALNPVATEVKTENPVVSDNKQVEDKAILSLIAEDKAKAPAEEKANQAKLAVNQTPPQSTSNAASLANEANQVAILRDTLFPNINTIQGKEAHQMVVTTKPLEAPEIPVDEMPIIDEERRRLVFIPPTEIFANVTSTLSYYLFSPNKGDQIVVNNFSSSSQRLGFAAQLGFVYPLAKKMDLRTGLSYFSGKSRISYGVTDNSQKSVTVLNDNSVQINPAKSTKDENRNWQYFELQSDVLYEVRKMQALSLGMKFGLQTSALNRPLLQARAGYRVSKAIGEHWALWLEPTVSVSLFSHRAIGDLFMYRTTGLGLNMGVSLLR